MLQPLQGLAERMQKSTSFQKAAGKLKIQESLKKEDCETVGQDELQGYDVVAFNRLKVQSHPSSYLQSM